MFYWKWPTFGRKCLLRPKIPLTAEILVTAKFRLLLSCILQLWHFGKNPLSVTHYNLGYTESHLCSIIPPEMDQKKYDFVFDRLRGVRQDLVIAQSKFDVASAVVDVLQVSVRFHLWANFRCASNLRYSFVCHWFSQTPQVMESVDPDTGNGIVTVFIGIPSAF